MKEFLVFMNEYRLLKQNVTGQLCKVTNITAALGPV
jgi:hypothetical protein